MKNSAYPLGITIFLTNHNLVMNLEWRFIQVVASINRLSFISLVEFHGMGVQQLVHLFVEGHLGWFHVGAIINTKELLTFVYISF